MIQSLYLEGRYSVDEDPTRGAMGHMRFERPTKHVVPVIIIMATSNTRE